MGKRLLRLLFNHSPYQTYKVKGNSMSPCLKEGDILIVKKTKKVKIRDIIALTNPQDQRTIVKRIIKIEDHKFFVQGDNESASTDSRDFGLIERDNIIGKIVAIV